MEEFSNDAEAEKLDNEGDDRWFMKYDMLQISPDYDYVSRYNDYCRNIGLDTCILLVESPYKYFEVEEIGNNDMVYGYDCIGTIGYSYLCKDRISYAVDYEENGITLNEYGLFDSIDSAEKFIELYNNCIGAGKNIENYWEMTIIRLSSAI